MAASGTVTGRQWPLDTLLYPTNTGQLIQGFVQQYMDGGSIPQWSSDFGNAYSMTGTDSDVVFADAYLKGVTNFDVTAAYDAALRNASVANSRQRPRPTRHCDFSWVHAT